MEWRNGNKAIVCSVLAAWAATLMLGLSGCNIGEPTPIGRIADGDGAGGGMEAGVAEAADEPTALEPLEVQPTLPLSLSPADTQDRHASAAEVATNDLLETITPSQAASEKQKAPQVRTNVGTASVSNKINVATASEHKSDNTDGDTRTSSIPLLKDLVADGALGEDYPLLSGYGPRDSYGGQISSDHKGLDFGMDVGTVLYAPARCTVAHVGSGGARGNWVVLNLGDGWYVEYQHLSSLVVATGDALSAGSIVGWSGETGASLVPHLHMEVIHDEGNISDYNDNSNRLDPYPFVFGDATEYKED